LPLPVLALAKGTPGATKFFITAPFMIVGSVPARSMIQPVMPVTVDLPLVPPIAIEVGAALNRADSNSARLARRQPSSLARATSGTVSSIAALATRTCSGRVMPLPSCGNRAIPCASNQANFSALRPWSRLRSEPAISAPRACRMQASGSMPEPPMPQKKNGRPERSAGTGAAGLSGLSIMGECGYSLTSRLAIAGGADSHCLWPIAPFASQSARRPPPCRANSYRK